MHCSHELNKRIPTHTINSSKIFLIYIHHHDNPSIDFNLSTLNTHHHSSLISRIALKNTNFQGILRNYDPITHMYVFCPLTKTFIVEESRLFIVPLEYNQPVEIPILEFNHSTKYNHKLFNLIQHTNHEITFGTEELKTIKALQLLWPLLHFKNIIRILAKLLTTSDAINDIFPHGFFPDD